MRKAVKGPQHFLRHGLGYSGEIAEVFSPAVHAHLGGPKAVGSTTLEAARSSTRGKWLGAQPSGAVSPPGRAEPPRAVRRRRS